MSDVSVASAVTGLVTITTMVIGFLTLWVKLKYGVDKADEAARVAKVVEDKVDDNTAITARIEKQTNGGLDERLDIKFQQLADHDARITALEAKVEAVKVATDALGKNLDSTRHEMRGHLQTISTNLHVLTANVGAIKKEPQDTK